MIQYITSIQPSLTFSPFYIHEVDLDIGPNPFFVNWIKANVISSKDLEGIRRNIAKTLSFIRTRTVI